MGRKVTLSGLLPWIGVFIGTLFVFYTVYTMGYFSVLGPELLGFYLETNFVQGAILSIPGLVGVVSASLPALGILGGILLMDDESIRNNKYLSITSRINPDIVMLLMLVVCVATSVTLNWFFPDRFFLLQMIVFLILFGANVIKGVSALADRQALNSILQFACSLVAAYGLLLFLGKYSASNDIEKDNVRYSVYTEGKSFINVNIVFSSSSVLVIKSGSELIFYERSQVKRVERLLKRVETN